MFNIFRKRKQDFTHPEPNSTAIGFVLFDDRPVDEEAIKAALRPLLGDEAIEKVEYGEPDQRGVRPMNFECEAGYVFVTPMEGAIPDNEVQLNAERNMLWENPAEDLVGYSNTVMVTVANLGMEMEGECARGTALRIRIVHAAVIDVLLGCPGALGVYIGDQRIAWPAGMFRETMAFAENQDRPPVEALINVTASRDSVDGRFIGFTSGLEPFGHAELVVPSSTADPEAIHQLLLNTSLYLLTNDVHLTPGETLGYSADMKITVDALDEDANPFFDAPALAIGM